MSAVFRRPTGGQPNLSVGIKKPNVSKVSVASVGAVSGSRFLIEDIYPSVDGGRFPVKRIASEPLDVWADIFREGHEVIAADLLWRPERDRQWSRVRMRDYGNDRWMASFTPPKPGRYVYAVEAWTDAFATWRRDFLLKRQADQELGPELQEARDLLAGLQLATKSDAETIGKAAREVARTGEPDALLTDSRSRRDKQSSRD